MYWWVVDDIALGLGTGLALWGAWWFWWRLPKRQVDRLNLKIRDAKARADVEDNFRKTIGQFMGGVAVLLGAGFAYLQFSEQQHAAHELLISNQVSKGFEQFGSDNIRLRLGGIYALEGVMNASEPYSEPVLEALSAFVRDNTRNTHTGDEKPATDIQAVLTVIGRRVQFGPEIADLVHAHIPKADLAHANLIGADLRHVDLSGAFLFGADLTGADLRHANLSGAFLGPDLSGGAAVNANLTRANLSDANLTSTDLRQANLTRATLTDANLSHADLRGATVSPAQLNTACGTEAKLDHPSVTLNKCP
jgi:uncharacterized protein YjbI with pentapeptide repeats